MVIFTTAWKEIVFFFLIVLWIAFCEQVWHFLKKSLFLFALYNTISEHKKNKSHNQLWFVEQMQSRFPNNLPPPVQMRGLRTEAIQNISPWSQWYLANVNLLLPLRSCQLASCAQQKRSKVAVPLHTHICASPFQHYVHLLYCLWNTCK